VTLALVGSGERWRSRIWGQICGQICGQIWGQTRKSYACRPPASSRAGHLGPAEDFTPGIRAPHTTKSAGDRHLRRCDRTPALFGLRCHAGLKSTTL